MVPLEDAHLVIDWTQVHFYNTVMGLVSGASLAGLAGIASGLVGGKRINPTGWSITLLVGALVLLPTGIHMTLTWPLAPMGSTDNIAFGEPVLILGALCLGLSAYFWFRGSEIAEAKNPLAYVSTDLRHLKWIIWLAGLALIAIAIAGVTWHLFTAPPEEPLAGLEAVFGIPYASTYLIAGIWAVLGVVALGVPVVLERMSDPDATLPAAAPGGIMTLRIAGLALGLTSAMVYFTHMGMVLNTAA